MKKIYLSICIACLAFTNAFAQPTATISGTTSICNGNAAPNITFTGANSTAPYTFTYTINGGANQTISTTSGNSVTLAVATATVGVFTYSLVSVTDANSNTQAQTGSAAVTVNPLPTATIAGTIAVCNGSVSPNITFTGANSTAPYTFTYTLNGGTNQTVSTAAGNSITIAAPTNLSGTFTYALVSVQDASITTCSQIQSGSAMVTVNPLPTATVSGTISLCSGSPSPNITFTGANSTAPYTFTYNINQGQNQTVTTAAGSNSVTVPAPTTTSGVFTYYLVSVQDASSTSCIQQQAGSATVTVNPLPTATIQGTTTICQNSQAPNITFRGANSTAPYTFTYNINQGQNQTVTTTAGSSSVTVAAPTTTAGTFTYALVGVQDASATTCYQAQAGNAVVTVDPNATITLTSPIGTTNQTLCVNFPMTTITYTVSGGATTASIIALPPGVTGSYSGGVVTISGTPSVSGTFNYTVTTAGSCVQTIAAGSIIVEPNASIALTSLAGTDAQSVTINSPITAITYTVSGGATGATITGMPSGVTGSFASPTITISGTPSVSGTYTYTVTTTGTCVQTMVTGSITISQSSSLNATISGTTTVCQNAAAPNITFTGVNGTAPYTFTYNINGGANQTVSSAGANNSITVSAPTTAPGSFTYALVSVTDANSNIQALNSTATIIVNLLPTATISGTISLCQNSASPVITFTGGNATAPYTFTYTLNGTPNQVSTAVGNSVTVAATTAAVGPYTYALVSIQDASSTACSQAQQGNAVVTVNPLPTAQISGTTAVCNGSAAPNITFTGGNATAPYTFYYRINGGAAQTVSTAGGNSVTIAATTAAAGTYNYSLISVQDASSTTCSQAQQSNATVAVNPLPTATIAGTKTVSCGSSAPSITFTGANGTEPYTFSYTLNGGQNQTITSPVGSNTATISAPTSVQGTFTYALVSVMDGSSTACSQVQQGNAVVTVGPMLVNILSTNPSAISACNGYLEAAAQGIKPYTYVWVDSNKINTPYRYGVCKGTYGVTVTDSTGCSGSAKAYINVNTPPASVDPLTISAIPTNATSTNICNGSAVATVTGGTKPYTIYFGGDSVKGATTYKITNLCSGFYTVNVKDAQSKTASFTFVIGAPPTTHSCSPSLYVDSTAKDTLVHNAIPNCTINYASIDSIKITGHNIFGLDSITVTWTIYQPAVKYTQVTNYGFTLPGVYVLLLDLFCTDRASGSVVGIDKLYIDKNVTGIETYNVPNVSVYPNPTSGIINLNMGQLENAQVNIYNTLGESIYQHTITSSIFQIDLSAQPNGVYFIKIITEQGVVNKKIVISK